MPVSPRAMQRVESVNVNNNHLFIEREEDFCRKIKTLETRISHLVSEKMNMENALT
jgi:hypothetical protein